MTRTKPEYFIQNAFSLKFIDDVSDQLHLLSLFVDFLFVGELVPAVMPLGNAILVLERYDDDICIVVTAEEVLVGIDESIWEFIADVVHLLLCVLWPSQQIVDAVHAAKQRKGRLSLEILCVHLGRFY